MEKARSAVVGVGVRGAEGFPRVWVFCSNAPQSHHRASTYTEPDLGFHVPWSALSDAFCWLGAADDFTVCVCMCGLHMPGRNLWCMLYAW